MKQGMPFSIMALALACLPAMALGAQSSYRQTEREYATVVSAYVKSAACTAERDNVVEAQKGLANTVARLSSADGEGGLLFAVTANRPDDVGRLLAAGAQRTGDNGSLWHAAATFGSRPVMEALMRAGLGLEDHGGASASPLFAAVQSNRSDNVDWLVQHGANVNAVDTSGAPVIRHALVCGNSAVIQQPIA